MCFSFYSLYETCWYAASFNFIIIIIINLCHTKFCISFLYISFCRLLPDHTYMTGPHVGAIFRVGQTSIFAKLAKFELHILRADMLNQSVW